MDIIRAPRLNAQNLPWFNVKAPLDLPDLSGKLVILDFWTFCCINCIHIIPTLKKLEERYPKNLVVIGVHSPKFSSEKLPENLKQAIDRYEIKHPVVHDTDFSIWKSYTIRAWPTLVFIDPEGYILGQISGEPNPDTMLEIFDKLIEDMNKKEIFHGSAESLQLPPLQPEKSTLRFPGKISYSIENKEFAIADSNHNQIVTADRDGNITRRIGSGEAGSVDGTLAEVQFFRPQGLCYQNGIIWVADTENHLIRMVDLISGQVFTAAGTGVQGSFLKEKGKAISIALSSPWDVALAGGDLYIANAGTHQIGIYDVSTGTLAPFAGTGEEALKDGPRLAGAFAQPSGLSIGNDKLFLADSETSSIRSIRIDEAGFIATYVGTGLFDFGDRDGKGREALIQHPLGIHYSKEKIYIADSYNNKIRVLDLKTLEVATVRASVELVCDQTSCTRLNEPAGVLELDNCLYVSDTNNHRILKIDLKTETTSIFIQ